MSRTPAFIAVLTLTVVIATSASVRPANGAEPAIIRSRIRHEPLTSTALATAGYSKKMHIMEIEFWNGAVYRYLDVPPAVYRDFLSAESKTRYYDWNIKGRYRSLRLRAADRQVSR